MSQMKIETITGTTNSGGTVTVYSQPITGELYSLVTDFDSLGTTADVTITGNETGIPVLTLTNLGTPSAANSTWTPRTATHNTSAAAALYAAGGTAVNARIPLSEQMKVAVVQGGDTKAFTLYAYWR